jgi:hypothetical protein
MLQFRIAEGYAITGGILRKLVGAGQAPSTGVVCWGRSYTGSEPTLNASASRANKLQQLQKFKAAGILTPPFWEKVPTAPSDFPVLGRTLSHHGGKDITLLMQPGDASLYPDRDYFMRYVPRATEYRVWIYRRRHLGTYEKRQVKASSRIGANHRNGFSFQLLNSESVPEGLRDIASKAVDCLGLDFGAVDILKGVDNALYTLEVNSAPGVEGENRQVIQALATKIRTWERLGFPKRNGATKEV